MTTCYNEQMYQLLFEIYSMCYLELCCEIIGKSMSLTMQKFQNVLRPSIKFERLLIGYISKCKDRLSISILALIRQP